MSAVKPVELETIAMIKGLLIVIYNFHCLTDIHSTTRKETEAFYSAYFSTISWVAAEGRINFLFIHLSFSPYIYIDRDLAFVAGTA